MSDKDGVHWFPMRVTYRRELKVRDALEREGIECFVPMHYEWVGDMENAQKKLVPAIHNLIFVHTTQNILTTLKMTRQELEPLRYIMYSTPPSQAGKS